MIKTISKVKSIHFLYIFAISWSLLLLTKFVPFVAQPESIIGYLWKYEFAIALFLSVFCVFVFKSKSLDKFIIFEKNEFYFVILPLFFFSLWSFLSIFWAQSERHALHHSLLWSCYFVFYLFARLIVKHPRLLKTSLVSLGIVLTLFAALCFIEYVAFAFGIDGSNIGFRYSKFAEISIILIPIFLLSILKLKEDKWLISSAITIILWILVLCSFGRTQFLVGSFSILITLFLVFYFKFDIKIKNRVLKTVVALFLITVFLNVFATFSSNSISTISRLTDTTDISAQDSAKKFRPLMLGISYQMFIENPLLGVGADNFLIDYKNARTAFSSLFIEESITGSSEDIIPERSHNEFAQILAELGIIGFLLFAWLLFGIFKMTLNLRKHQSPIGVGSIIGLYAFLICSLVTSFSFRVPANGICFFFVLALAVSKLFDSKKSIDLRKLTPQMRPVLAFASILICVATLTFSFVRGTNLYCIDASQKTTDKFEIEQNLKNALYFDQNDGLSNYEYARFLSSNKQYSEAAKYYRNAINNGISTSTAFFDLATNQILANENIEASNSFQEAIKLYPRSIFLRTNYAKFLEENKYEAESNEQLAIAYKLNESDAKSWWLLLSRDFSVVKIHKEKVTETMNLQPLNGVYAVIDFQKEKYPMSISVR